MIANNAPAIITPQRAARIVLERRAMRKRLAPFTRKVFETVSPDAEYLHNWHIDLICEYAEAVHRREITRLIVNMPTRYLKSICFSVALPAWIIGQSASEQIITASYSSSLSIKHSMDTRLVIQQQWYRDLFPGVVLASDQNEKSKFVTTERGHRIATSVGGTMTGEGGNYIFIDDPVNPQQAMSEVERTTANTWYDQTASTRLNDKKAGAVIVVMQRLHKNDLTGHLLEKGGWTHLSIPAVATKHMVYAIGGFTKTREEGDILHPDREGPIEIAAAKITLGSYGYSAQYQQNPSPEGGGIIKREWFQYYKELPKFTRRVQSWDTAFKKKQENDYSVNISAVECLDGYYLTDLFRDKMEFPELKRQAKSMYDRDRPEVVLIEDKASGQSLIQELQRDTLIPLKAVPADNDAIVRVNAISPTVEARRVFLPEGAPWVADFVNECAEFPKGSHDDQVIAFAQLIAYLRGGGQWESGKL